MPNTVISRFNLASQEVAIIHRPSPSPDETVISEIFCHHSYGFGEFKQGQALASYYNTAVSQGGVGFICDAGANIGAASLYFRRWFPRTTILAIEPDEENISILKRNLEPLSGCQVFAGALTNSSDGAYLTKIDHWSHRVGEQATGNPVPTISPSDVLVWAKKADYIPFIFKVDIEGSEDSSFATDTEWVDEFPLVVIEFHDWMLPFAGSSRNAIRAIAKFDFELIMKGQLAFFFNVRLLKSFA